MSWCAGAAGAGVEAGTPSSTPSMPSSTPSTRSMLWLQVGHMVLVDKKEAEGSGGRDTPEMAPVYVRWELSGLRVFKF